MQRVKAAAEPAAIQPRPFALAEIATENPAAARHDALDACPDCGRSLPPGSVLCTSCGYDSRQGRRLIGAVARVRGEREGDRALREERESIRFKTYAAPIATFVVSVGLMLAFLSNTAHAPEAMIAGLISLGISIPVGLAVFWLMSVLWIGVDAPIHLTVLRLAGIYGVGNAMRAFWIMLGATGRMSGMAFTPGLGRSYGMMRGVGAVGGTIFGSYVLLHMVMLELEKEEAVLVAFVTGLAQIFVVLAIQWALQG